jgi:hypothetical protein
MAAGAQRVYLHVGLPKTGTSYLQDRMWHNHEAALRHGVLYPGGFPEAHFHAAVHIQPERYLAWVDPVYTGAWEKLVKEVRAWPGTSLISHELFATATESQAAQAVRDLAPAEVHVVCTARDLARQIPSVWQENIKNLHDTPFSDFVRAIREQQEPEDPFWEFQELPRILRTWGRDLAAQHVHVITVPQSGGDPKLLWRRFIGVVGLRDEQLPADVPTHNQALSMAQIEMLRRMNTRLRDNIEWARYESVVKEYLIGSILFESASGNTPALPASELPWVRDISEKFATEIRSAGYDVIGDLTELMPVDTPTRVSVEPDPAEMLELMADTLAVMVRTMPEAPPKRFTLPERVQNRLLRESRRITALRRLTRNGKPASSTPR